MCGSESIEYTTGHVNGRAASILIAASWDGKAPKILFLMVEKESSEDEWQNLSKIFHVIVPQLDSLPSLMDYIAMKIVSTDFFVYGIGRSHSCVNYSAQTWILASSNTTSKSCAIEFDVEKFTPESYLRFTYQFVFVLILQFHLHPNLCNIVIS